MKITYWMADCLTPHSYAICGDTKEKCLTAVSADKKRQYKIPVKIVVECADAASRMAGKVTILSD